MRVFLTGSTGLLGSNTVSSLLARGHEVVALARDPAKAARVLPVADERVRVVSGDIEAPDAWLPRLAEVDAVIHTAAYFREYFGRGDHDAKLRALNVDLPVRLAREADARGLRGVIVSSSGVLGPRPDGQPVTESDPAEGATPENAYFMSKVAMERELTRLAPTLSRPPILVRPGWMFGPGDHAPTSAGGLVRDLLTRGSLEMVSGPPVHTADARDVADGIVAALERAPDGAVYNLAGNPLPAVDALREIARQIGGRTRVRPVPMAAALALSVVLEGITRVRGVANPIPRVGLLTLSRGVPISSAKAERELGVRFRPFPETARDTVAFCRAVLAATPTDVPGILRSTG